MAHARFTRKRLALCLVAAALMLACAGDAWAAEPDNSLDKITGLFQTASRHWEEVLSKLAMQLFLILAAIELAWSGIKLALKGADLSEWLADLLNQVLFIGFFYLLLTNSSTWAGLIVDSFRQAADRSVTVAVAHATSVNQHVAITPSNIFDMGVNLAGHIFQQWSVITPIANAGLELAGLLVLICFALIAAFMIVALVESYVVISAGVLLMGFGGSRWTKDYAVKTFVYAVSVGAKLFVMQLIVGAAYSQLQTLRAAFSSSLSDMFVILGAAVVLLALVKVIPDMVQGLVNGAAPNADGVLIAAGRQAIQTTVAIASGSAGGAMAADAAGRLAGEQMARDEAEGRSSRSRAGRFAKMAGYFAKNMSDAAVENVGDRLRGHAPFGARFGQMADSMRRKAEAMAAERARPAAEAFAAPQDNVIRAAAPSSGARGGGRGAGSPGRRQASPKADEEGEA